MKDLARFLAIFLAFLTSTSMADTVQLTLDDGTIIEIDGVPKGTKLKARVIQRVVEGPEFHIDGIPEGFPGAVVPGRKPAPGRPVAFDPAPIIKSYLNETLDDPSRLSIVKISEPVLIQNCLFWPGLNNDEAYIKKEIPASFKPLNQTGTVVICRFRAPNKVGALILGEKAFLINDNHQVFKMISPHSVILPDSPEAKVVSQGGGFIDPKMEKFLNSADGIIGQQQNKKQPAKRTNK